jgi:hypothetical protein
MDQVMSVLKRVLNQRENSRFKTPQYLDTSPATVADKLNPDKNKFRLNDLLVQYGSKIEKRCKNW